VGAPAASVNEAGRVVRHFTMQNARRLQLFYPRRVIGCAATCRRPSELTCSP